MPLGEKASQIASGRRCSPLSLAPFECESCGIPAIYAIFRWNTAVFLCTSDCVAEEGVSSELVSRNSLLTGENTGNLSNKSRMWCVCIGRSLAFSVTYGKKGIGKSENNREKFGSEQGINREGAGWIFLSVRKTKNGSLLLPAERQIVGEMQDS